ncbi:hypothetical protein RJ641_018283 [Dillenia turbinata]|uniref:Uncharacterized protein n=1 Tax=Dillenia turbinata TaxID=194707 RepID=A0AAN8UY37_9MAGN
METLIFKPSQSLLLVHSYPIKQIHRNLVHISPRTHKLNPKSLSPCRVTTSKSTGYGGWDELSAITNSKNPSELNQLRNLFVSVGIDDQKYVFLFVVGFVSALAISRVRISSVIVFPASVLFLVSGFSFGFVHGGGFNKKKTKDETFRVYVQKLISLVQFFDELNSKLSNLKSDVQKAIDSNEIRLVDLESYVKGIDSISELALPARNLIEVTTNDDELADSKVVGKIVNPKPRRKELNEIGNDLLQYFGGLFREKLDGSKPNKSKDVIKQDNQALEVTEQSTASRASKLVKDSKEKGNMDMFNNGALDRNDDAIDYDFRRRRGDMNIGKLRTPRGYFDSEECSYMSSRQQVLNKGQISLNMGSDIDDETCSFQESVLDSVDFSVTLKRMQRRALFGTEKMLGKSNGVNMFSDNMEQDETVPNRSYFKEEKNSEDNSFTEVNHFVSEEERGSAFSSLISADVAFDRYLFEANALLKEARMSLKNRGNEGHAETKLYKSAKLLSKAIAMKPMSLIAVGQLGNTYLLHGELKLKMSRKLRNLLNTDEPSLPDIWNKELRGLNLEVNNKDKLASILINVCEECEQLLIQAGRKYRMALSIDGNDIRALYNWGLALSFRAQLIADIGPEAAYEADKVFMAAIDKFDAMLSRSKSHAPDALFRWGMALQQRSHLRPRNSKEKVKLLQQAKRLYEDALVTDEDNLQVREALSLCISELNYKQF